MVKIRLARYGTKKRPFYKIIVADSRFSRDGRFIEHIGYFDPISKKVPQNIKLNIDRIEYWKKKGAQISERTKKIIKLSNKTKVSL